MKKKQLLELSKLAENELKDKTKYIGWEVGREEGEQDRTSHCCSSSSWPPSHQAFLLDIDEATGHTANQ
jgi:hypothetical protein